MIAGALYLALRRPAQLPAASPAPPAAAPRPTTPTAPPREVSAGRVTTFLDAQKPRFRETCWDPIVARAPEPASATYVFDVTVGPDGHEVIRSILEQRGKSRADVAQCLRAISDAPIVIPPPGESVHVTWTLSFP